MNKNEVLTGSVKPGPSLIGEISQQNAVQPRQRRASGTA
jgi:hypothetical protein